MQNGLLGKSEISSTSDLRLCVIANNDVSQHCDMTLNHRTRMCAYDCEVCSSSFSDKLFNEAHTNSRSSHQLTTHTFFFQMETPPLRYRPPHIQDRCHAFLGSGAGHPPRRSPPTPTRAFCLTIHSHVRRRQIELHSSRGEESSKVPQNNPRSD